MMPPVSAPPTMSSGAPAVSSGPPTESMRARSETPPWGTPMRPRSQRPPANTPSERPIPSDVPPPVSIPRATTWGPQPAAARYSTQPPATPPMPMHSPPSRAPVVSAQPPANSAPPPPLPARDDLGMLSAEERLDTVANATDRDQLVASLLHAARAVARRVAVFAVRKNQFSGWTCSPEFAPLDRFRLLTVPLGAPSVLALATVAGSHFGAITKNETHAPLLQLMGTASRDVAVFAVRATGRAALILLADELSDTMIGTRYLERLASVAGGSLSRLMRTGVTV